jgi:L-amino acid N-acyltransferase
VIESVQVKSESLLLRNARLEDLPIMLEIYNDAVLMSSATFDLEPLDIDTRKKWFYEHDMHYPLITAEVSGNVAGYCSISLTREKTATQRQWNSPCTFIESIAAKELEVL